MRTKKGSSDGAENCELMRRRRPALGTRTSSLVASGTSYKRRRSCRAEGAWSTLVSDVDESPLYKSLKYAYTDSSVMTEVRDKNITAFNILHPF